MKRLLTFAAAVTFSCLVLTSCTPTDNTNRAGKNTGANTKVSANGNSGVGLLPQAGSLGPFKDKAKESKPPARPKPSPGVGGISQPQTARRDDGRTIDVLVVYTAKARQHFQNSGADITASINRAVDITNETFRNSQIDLQVRLVHAQEISFQESDSFDSDLDQIALGDGGAETRALRDQYHADQVTVIRYEGDMDGEAYELESMDPADFDWYAAHAYSMIRSSCVAQGYYCFTHELGHNLGAGHDFDNVHLYDDSHGYCFTYGGTQYGTMMSYCGADNRIFYFSNPDVKYPPDKSDAVPVGAAGQSNNARAIRDSKIIVANYRQSQ